MLFCGFSLFESMKMSREGGINGAIFLIFSLFYYLSFLRIVMIFQITIPRSRLFKSQCSLP